METSCTPTDDDALLKQIEVDAFRRLFPLRFFERHLAESIRPDARRLGEARPTTVALGAVGSADGSALTKIGSTTMLAAIKLEVMKPLPEAPNEGCIAVEFHMPPICSPIARPGRTPEAAPVISKQLSTIISSCHMIDLTELCISPAKSAWMAYLDVYCLDADGSLFDAALLASVSAFYNLKIPVVSLKEDGKVVLSSEEEGKSEKRKLKIGSFPLSLTCVLHKHFVLADPNAEEESIMDSLITVVLNSDGKLVSFFKPGGIVLANTSTVLNCISLTRMRIEELCAILEETASGMDVD